MPLLQAEALGATSIYVLLPTVTHQAGLQAHPALLAAHRAVDQILDERGRRT